MKGVKIYNYKNKPTIITNIIVLIIVSLLCFLVLEISVRLFTSESTYFFDTNTEIGVYNTPNLKGKSISPVGEFKVDIKLNSFGFNDVEHSKEKPSDVKRIAIIGDSFVESFQVDLNETMHRQLQNMLNQDKNQKYEVLAFGVGSTGTCEQYIRYKNLIDEFNPDTVLLMFFMRNDVYDNSIFLNSNSSARYRCFFDKTGEIDWHEPEESSGIRKIIRSTIKKSQLAWFFVKNMKPSVQSPPNVCNQTINGKNPLSTFLINQTDEFEYGWNITEKIIPLFREAVEKEGASFHIVTIPDLNQLTNDSWLYNTCPETINFTDMLLPDKRLAKITKDNGIPLLELLPIFKKYDSETKPLLHFPIDGHFTIEGHKLAAESMYNYLMQQKNEGKI